MKPLSDTYVEETRFGFWFLRSHTWQHHVLRVAINDLRSLFSAELPTAPVILDAGRRTASRMRCRVIGS